MSTLEESNARLAAKVVEEAGGFLSFSDYDKAMKDETYFYPINWIAGWGLHPDLRKANLDKLCAFAACEMGLLTQTDEGYAVPRKLEAAP